MLGYILLPIMNIALFVGEFRGIDGSLNIALFIMWVYAIIHILGMFARDEDLLKVKDRHWLNVWAGRTLTVITIMHSVYWGYILVPTLWTIGVIVRWARIYEINNRTHRY
mgnify:CR=1 FL=1